MSTPDKEIIGAIVAEPEQNGTHGPKTQINLPGFDIFGERAHGPQIRAANDRSFERAEVRDIAAMAIYAQKVAVSASMQIVNASAQLQADHTKELIQHEVEALARAIDLAIGQAIEKHEADAWYRRLWRWMANVK